MGTLWEALEAVPDRRTKKGRRYELASIVGLTLAAMLAGANDLLAVCRFGRRLTPKAREMLGIKRGTAPCHATYHYVFQSIAATDLEQALGKLVVRDGPVGHIALDGKRLRGSRQDDTSPGVHILHTFSTRLQASLGSLVVPPGSGEAVEAIALLKSLDLTGAIITGDAAFTFAELARTIRDRGGHYFLFVKGNQPELQAELAHSFGDDSPLKACQPARAGAGADRSAGSCPV